MRFRGIGLMLAVVLAAASIGVAGCGTSKHSTAKKAAVVGAAALAIHHHHKKVEQKRAAAAGYTVGQSCSPSNAAAYKKAGFTCAKERNSYRLQKP